MTTGAPIYLVSACSSGEEFVAAFRRYADKNGLFIPIAAPLPSGKRGRFAVTLGDGGVMIEGDAEIVSSAATPSVLHGRVGMTLRFVEPDIKSKTVLVELEQARLAMKPQPPSVPPRPAQVPASPRPVVPAPGGRIDANNARAECVAIGDVDALVEAPQAAKPSAKFVVPPIPAQGAPRPKTPSGPAPTVKPPTSQQPVLQRPATPSQPPPIKPLPASAGASTAARLAAASRPTEQAPPLAKPAPGNTPTAIATPPISITPTGMTAVAPPLNVTPTGMTAVAPTTSPGVGVAKTIDTPPPAEDEVRDTIAMPALVPVPQARAAEMFAVPNGDGDTFTGVPRPKHDSDTLPATSIPTAAGSNDTIDVAVPEPIGPSSSRPHANGGSARVGLPPPRRTTGNTNPPPRTPTPSAPLPVVARQSGPRTATHIGLPITQPKTPAPPSGEIPLPPIVADAKPAAPIPDATDEPTDITSMPPVDPEEVTATGPIPTPLRTTTIPDRIPGGMRKTVMGVAVVPDGVTVLPATPGKPVTKVDEDEGSRDTALMDAAAPSAGIVGPRTIDARAATAPPQSSVEVHQPEAPEAEVDAAEAADATEAVDAAEAADTPKAPAPAPEAAPPPKATVKPPGPVVEEPSGDWTMVPGASGPTILPRMPGDPPAAATAESRIPTGDWTIARVEDSPSGWSEPSKVDIQPVRANIRVHTGPPVPVVSGEKPLEVTSTAKQFDIEEETKSGLKIEIDSSLPVETPVPGSLPMAPPMGPPMAMAPAPMPSPMASMQPMLPMASMQPMQPMQPMMPQLPRAQTPTGGSGSFPSFPRQPSSQAMLETVCVNDSTSVIDVGRKKRVVVIAVSAALVAVAGVVVLLVLMRGGGDKPAASKKTNTTVPVVADAAVVESTPPATVDAAVEKVDDTPPPDDKATAVRPTPASGECTVDIATTPDGAEIVRDKEVLGTTPTTIALPCDTETKILLRKARYVSASRVVTAKAAGTKVRVALGKNMLNVKVTSSPPGATITVAGKSAGVTPAVIKLPALETSTLVISKPGFAADTQKFTPKQNNQSVHVSLKKKGR